MDQQAWDILLCGAVLIFVILPRFNRWPASEQGQFQGRPRDYIHDRVFFCYSVLYFFTFVLLTYALSRFEVLREVLVQGEVAPAAAVTQDGILQVLQSVFGPQSLVLSLTIIVALLQIPAVSKADEKWRSALLTAARVPKAAFGLKLQIVDALNAGRLTLQADDAPYQSLLESSGASFWRAVLAGDHAPGSIYLCGRMVLQAMHLLKLNKQFEYQYPGANDLQRIETRLSEIAAVLPAQTNGNALASAQEYRQELEKLLGRLSEILAKHCVKNFPEQQARYSALSQYGFSLDFVDSKESNILLATMITVVGILAATVFTIMLFLALFDAVGMTRRGGDWFSAERILLWSFGAWVSYALAACFGLIFNEALKGPLGERSLPTYGLAFVFGVLGSCVFFFLSRETLTPPFVWLSISFGLLSIVVIRSRGRYFVRQPDVQTKAIQIAGQYALLSGVLQVLIHLSFRGLETTAVNVVMFFLFGACRGFAVAFLVAYILMECERMQQQGSRRRFPRVPYRQSVSGSIGGRPLDMYVKNLSEQGALVQFRETVSVTVGDTVCLAFEFGTMQGQIVETQNTLVRVKFDTAAAPGHGIHRFIRQEMGLAA